MNLTRRSVIAMAAAAAVPASLVACRGSAGEQKATGKSSLTLGIDPTYYGLIGNPLDGATLQYFGAKASYEGLLSRDPLTNKYIPLLATEYVLADDRKSMTVQLRQDVDFADGAHLDAKAVADYCSLVFASDGYVNRPQVVDYYRLRVTATGKYALKLTTVKAMDESFFNQFMIWTGIASPQAARDRKALKEKPAGTGPYLVEEVVPGVSISYARNPRYWDPDAIHFDKLKYQVFEDEVAAANALKGGQIDATVLSSAALTPELESAGFRIARGGGTYRAIVITDFTGQTVKAFGDVRVRRAIAMALDQKAILETLERGNGTLSDQPFSKLYPEYLEGADDRYPYDVDAAKKLMAEAGYAGGFDLVMPSAPVFYYPTALEPAVKQALAEIGIRVSYKRLPDGAALGKAWSANTYPARLTNIGYHQTMSVFRGPTPPLGGHFFDDPTFNTLTTTISNGSTAASTAASKKLGEHLMEQAWILPILHFGVAWATSPKIDLTVGTYSFWLDLRSIKATK